MDRDPTSPAAVDADVRRALESIYEEMMWLAARPNVTPSRARGWYTHIMAEALKRRIRRFSGYVSKSAAQSSDAPLMLEHYGRIQTMLTALVARHRSNDVVSASEFVDAVIEHEQVHIVTRHENYAAMRAKGDYKAAGIVLVRWRRLPLKTRQRLWQTMLKGRVANALDFRPSQV